MTRETPQETTVRRRTVAYVAISLMLILANGLIWTSTWNASPAFHTMMEVVATMLAAVVGVVALVRYYSQKNNTMLLIGTGFLGSSLLDGYHTVITSWPFMARFPSPPPSLIPWSWLASHLFLSVLLWWSSFAARTSGKHGEVRLLNERIVFGWVAMLTLATGILFALVPLPRAIYPELAIPRPQELIPAAFLLAALVGYLRKGVWKESVSEHWLVLCILMRLLGMVPSMALSSRLHDQFFQGAHLFKQLSYLSVLIGLLFGMYELFRKAEMKTQELDEQVKTRTVELAQTIDSLQTENIERRLAEASLQASEEKFRQLAETITEVFWISSPDLTKILYISPAYETIWGKTCKSLYENPMSFLDSIRPEDRERAMAQITEGQRKGEGFDQEYRIMRPDESVRWIWDRGYPVRDASGNVCRIAGVAQDITGRKQAEEALRKTEAQLQQSQKTEAIGRLAGGVAHEFNNLLTVVTGYCEFLLLGLGPRDVRRKEVTLIKRAGEQAMALIQQLLALSRQQVYSPRTLNLNESVMKAEQMLRPLLGELVPIQTVLDPALAYVKADPVQIEQVLINLALNARDAMPDGGQFTIRTRNVDRSSGQAEPTSSGLPGASVLLEVSDTGCGMDAETKEHIFEPFFTTEKSDKGKWLGLAPVHGIVTQNGGSIEVDSAPGKGTTVRIYLLRIAPDAEIGTASAAADLLSSSKALHTGRSDSEIT